MLLLLDFFFLILVCFVIGERGLGFSDEDKVKLYFEDYSSQNQGGVWERDFGVSMVFYYTNFPHCRFVL